MNDFSGSLYKKGDVLKFIVQDILLTDKFVVLSSERFQKNYGDLLVSDYSGDLLFDISENLVAEKMGELSKRDLISIEKTMLENLYSTEETLSRSSRSAGKITWAPVMFSNLAGIKPRPCIIVSSKFHEQTGTRLIVPTYTQRDKLTDFDMSLKNTPHDALGLENLSYVKSKIRTINVAALETGIGEMDEKRLAAVRDNILYTLEIEENEVSGL
jgi:mRNA-degrading endonuclease toxin of MazEF toxin-antitoxin module